MAGGWGGPIHVAMPVAPPPPPSRHRPQAQATPDIKPVAVATTTKPPSPALPAIGSEFTMSSGRQAEAEAFAAAMGNAFHITREQNKASTKRARAKGRAAQRAAEKRKRR